jgi:hypothetical protein
MGCYVLMLLIFIKMLELPIYNFTHAFSNCKQSSEELRLGLPTACIM